MIGQIGSIDWESLCERLPHILGHRTWQMKSLHQLTSDVFAICSASPISTDQQFPTIAERGFQKRSSIHNIFGADREVRIASKHCFKPGMHRVSSLPSSIG